MSEHPVYYFWFFKLFCWMDWDWRTVIKIVLGFLHLKLQMSNVDIIFVHKSISFHLSNSGLWFEPVPAVTGQQARYTIDISFKRISCVMHWERLTDAMWDIPKESALKLSVLLSRLHGIVFMTCRSITCLILNWKSKLQFADCLLFNWFNIKSTKTTFHIFPSLHFETCFRILFAPNW